NQRQDDRERAVEKGVEKVGNTVGGENVGKDLNQAVGTNEDGSEASEVEQKIAQAKLAGRGLNAVYGGNNALVNKGMDKVGEAAIKGARKAEEMKQAPKKELDAIKKTAGGRQMRDAVISDSAKANLDE